MVIDSMGTSFPFRSGYPLAMACDDSRRRFLMYSLGKQLSAWMDLETGSLHPMDIFEHKPALLAMGFSGRYACFTDYPGPTSEDGVLRVVDLTIPKIVANIKTEGPVYLRTGITKQDKVVWLGPGHLLAFDIHHPEATPDTLWSGNTKGGGYVMRNGTGVFVRDDRWAGTFIDPSNGTSIALGPGPAFRLLCMSYQATSGLVAVGGWLPHTLVYSLKTGERRQLPAMGEGLLYTQRVEFDPLDRWIMIQNEGHITGWTLPLDPLFSSLPTEELIERARKLTNVRVKPDPTSDEGYVLTTGNAE